MPTYPDIELYLETPTFGNMASFCRRRPVGPAWSVEQSALFAARKEFELLKLLDRAAALMSVCTRHGPELAAPSRVAS